MSPYMLGPYYKFQISSLLSITFRVFGVLLTVVGAPLAIAWVVCLALGEDTFEAYRNFLTGFIGQSLVLLCLFGLCYHLCNGIRHMIWDTGRAFSMESVRRGGYLMIAASVLLAALTLWCAS
jgi:succinate dehydrogenase / fumarate reductase cytochrome b subunit